MRRRHKLAMYSAASRTCQRGTTLLQARPCWSLLASSGESSGGEQLKRLEDCINVAPLANSIALRLNATEKTAHCDFTVKVPLAQNCFRIMHAPEETTCRKVANMREMRTRAKA